MGVFVRNGGPWFVLQQHETALLLPGFADVSPSAVSDSLAPNSEQCEGLSLRPFVFTVG